VLGGLPGAQQVAGDQRARTQGREFRRTGDRLGVPEIGERDVGRLPLQKPTGVPLALAVPDEQQGQRSGHGGRSVGGPPDPPAGRPGDDGHAGPVAIPTFRPPRRTLVLGGARSGKSSFAEQLLARRSDVNYVACGLVPDGTDLEWTDRVSLHRSRRPSSWQTLETVDLPAVLGRPGPPVLVDCLTTWLARVMDDCGVWAEAPDADARLAGQVDALVDAWRTTRRRVVAVSNEVGSGVVPATPSGRRFRDELGVLNTRVAATSPRVWLVTAGLPQRLR
jgi:adenosylcobinamide kinase/adenosylcobinamide-phosphate guanylyltransferase